MKIVDIREKVVPIGSAIQNAYISFNEMTCSAVAVISDVVRDGSPLVGFGFHSNGRYDQQGILRSRLIPRLMKADPKTLITDDGTNIDPFKAWAAMMHNEKPGGHGERSVAVGTLDMALWDLAAKIKGQPLYRFLADRFNNGWYDDRIYVYAAGGYYYPDKDIPALKDEIRSYLNMGYDTVKIKIGGAPLEQDRKRIEAVLSLLTGDQQLAVDANGRFDQATALDYCRALNEYDLKWYEEPGDPLDFDLLARVAEIAEVPLATGENIFSAIDALNLIRYGRLRPESDYLQVDPTLGYGLVEYLRFLDILKDNGWSPRRCIPHGGHQFALHLAAGLGLGGNESYPGLFFPFGGFADDVPIKNSLVTLPDAPGIGIELKSELMKVYRDLV